MVIENLRFAYEPERRTRVDVFHDLNLSVGAGQFVAILGPSGCGKTTLLDLIAGLLENQGGTLEREGPLGYVFQDYPYLPNKTAREHLVFPLRWTRRAAGGASSDQWLADLGLTEFADHPISSLSAGMKARVAYGTALISAPALVLLDEPFQSLDIETRTRLGDHLQRQHSEDRSTVIMVTHDLIDALLLADRVVVLGRIPTGVLVDFPVTHRASDRRTAFTNQAFMAEMSHLWNHLQHAIQDAPTTL